MNKLHENTMKATFQMKGEKASGEGYTGTIFFMNYPEGNSKNDDEKIIVTAKHVLEDSGIDDIIVNYRKKDANNVYSLVPTRLKIRNGGNNLYINHPSEDILIMEIRIPQDLEIEPLNYNLLSEDDELEKYELSPGDNVTCLGYPLGLASNNENFPILRTGQIASYPLLPTEETKTFLYTIPVFGGNSGGPVYFIDSNRVYGDSIRLGQTIMILMGVMSQEYTAQETVVSLEETTIKKYKLNLAKVVHASLVKKLIDEL